MAKRTIATPRTGQGDARSDPQTDGDHQTTTAGARPAYVGVRTMLTAFFLAITAIALTSGSFTILERIAGPSWLAGSGLRLFHIVRGVASSVVVAGTLGWYLLRRPVAVFPRHPPPEDVAALPYREAVVVQHLLWFVHMRWIAAAFTFALILIAVPISHLLPRAALAPLLGWWAVLPIANLFFERWSRRSRAFERQITVQVVTDLIILSGLLYFSGGVANPLHIAYLIHVIIAGMLLPRSRAFKLTFAAGLLFTAVAASQYIGLLPPYCLQFMPLFDGPGPDLLQTDEVVSRTTNALSESFSFLSILLLSGYLITLVADRLRQEEREFDVTARKLMLERQRLENVIDTTGVGVRLVAPDLTTIWCSRRVVEWRDRWTEGDRADLGLDGGPENIVARTFESGRAVEAEQMLTGDVGCVRYFRHIASPVRDHEGRTFQVVELIEDITQRKALEAEALHAGKLSSLGRMAAGIVHEIGNPLSSLSIRLHLMERRQEPAFVRESLGVLRSQIERMGRIVHSVSLFARSRAQEFKVHEINAIVEEAADIVALDRRAEIVTLRRCFSSSSPRVRGVRDQFMQVFINLLLNAVEAMRDGGEVVMETTQRDGEVKVAISDTGVGMSREEQERLFEPFVTTKEMGSGLGLSISYNFVHAHGGRIEVSSREGEGSTFTVILAAAEHGAGRVPNTGTERS